MIAIFDRVFLLACLYFFIKAFACYLLLRRCWMVA
jgi:hypothetical protein